MKKVFKELKDFTLENGNIAFFLFQAFLLVGLIFSNYSLGLDDWADSFSKTPLHFFTHLLIYAVPYFGTTIGYCLLVEKSLRRLTLKSILASIFALAVLAYNEYFYLHKNWISDHFTPHVGYLIHRCANNLISFLTYVLPLFVYWWIKHRKEQPFYGLNAKTFSPRTYFILLLIMVPIVGIASFQQGFIDYYPAYKDYGTADYYGVPEWLGAVIFEICYGLDFVSTEIYFRGFLILGMLEFLGPSAVFSMVSLYCVLHFGKPLGECVSSIFGGYVLGVITWNTRSIYGGVIIHLGIAWLMELFAFLQKM